MYYFLVLMLFKYVIHYEMFFYLLVVFVELFYSILDDAFKKMKRACTKCTQRRRLCCIERKKRRRLWPYFFVLIFNHSLCIICIWFLFVSFFLRQKFVSFFTFSVSCQLYGYSLKKGVMNIFKIQIKLNIKIALSQCSDIYQCKTYT